MIDPQHVVYSSSRMFIRKRMDILIQRTVEHGIMKYFNQKTKRILKIRSAENHYTTIENLSEAITFTDLLFAVAIFIISLIFSLIAFMVEIILPTIRKCFRNNWIRSIWS